MGLSSLPKFHPEVDIPAKQFTQEEIAFAEYRKTHPTAQFKASNPRPYPVSGRGSRGGGRGRGRGPRTITRDAPSTDHNDSYAQHVLQSQQRAALIKAQQTYQQQSMMQHLQAQGHGGGQGTSGPLAPQRGQQFYVDPYRLYAKVRKMTDW